MGTVIRNRKSQDRQFNDQKEKDKMIYKPPHRKHKDGETRTPLKTCGNSFVINKH